MMGARDHLTEDGAKLHLRLWEPPGSASGRPILLLHSLFFDGSMFDPVAAVLSRRRHVIVPDHRGQGRSTLGRHPATAERLARDMNAVCDTLVEGPLHVVGSSMGAYVAFEMLAAKPDRIASLSVSCCTCQAEADPARFEALAARIADADGKGLADTLMPLMFGDAYLWDPGRAENRALWRARFDDLPQGTDRVVAAIFEHRGWTALLQDWGGPVLALAGDADRAKSPADLSWIGEDGLGRFRCFPGAGHTLPVEAPDAYLAELAAFLDDVESAPSAKTTEPARPM